MAKKINPNSPSALIIQEILTVFREHPNKTFNYKQLAKPLGLKASENRETLTFSLLDLVDQGEILEHEPGSYKLKPQTAFVEGVIDITSSGVGYVINDNFEDDIYIAADNVKNALHRDRVVVNLYAKKRDRRMEGSVVKIVERARTEFAGVIQVSDKYAFLVPDSDKMKVDIFIPLQKLAGARNGQKAIARMTEWPDGAKNPVGEIIKVLGNPGENDAEMHAIIIEYGFPIEFPAHVEKEAAKISFDVDPAEIKKRRDFRDITTFTIDPEDAKDFDDALSIRPLENNTGATWEIGIHIADVSHYVKPGTELEKEAYSRATSVYLVDRVIPMLPEVLSNGVCSLRPNEDKLCFSAVFELDDEGTVHNEWIGRTVIHSNRRFSYEDAQKIIETGQGDFSKEVLTLDGIAKKLRDQRFKNGAIAFDKVEVKFRLDEKGDPIGVYTKENKDSNKLIEEFMLLANRKVAEFVGKVKKRGDTQKPFVYRIHDSPQPEKILTFSDFAKNFGYRIQADTDRQLAHSINKLMSQIKGKREENVLEQLAIRTMSKAIYSTENVGHYGLAFDYYTHFTSPIRRYPDVMVHRLLEHYLVNNKPAAASDLEDKCKHSTQMEITASEAERASIKYKQVQFLQGKEGVTFDGIISGVKEWGIYVEIIENKCEGMIRLRDIDNDFYEFDESNYCIVGSRTGNRYQLGDAVKVQLKRADLARKQIDFYLVDENGETPRKSSGGRGRRNENKRDKAGKSNSGAKKKGKTRGDKKSKNKYHR